MDPISIEEKVHHGDVWTVPAKGTLRVMGWGKKMVSGKSQPAPRESSEIESVWECEEGKQRNS